MSDLLCIWAAKAGDVAVILPNRRHVKHIIASHVKVNQVHEVMTSLPSLLRHLAADLALLGRYEVDEGSPSSRCGGSRFGCCGVYSIEIMLKTHLTRLIYLFHTDPKQGKHQALFRLLFASSQQAPCLIWKVQWPQETHSNVTCLYSVSQ